MRARRCGTASAERRTCTRPTATCSAPSTRWRTFDPDAVGGTIQRGDRNRAEGMESLAERLAEQDELRPGVTAEAAADLLWVLTSFDAYDLLVTGRGLSAEAAGDLLVETAERALFV